jgi:hypothetical protein
MNLENKGKGKHIVRKAVVAILVVILVVIVECCFNTKDYENVKDSNMALFASQFVLRINYVGIGRFAIACTADVAMEVKETRLEFAMRGMRTMELNFAIFTKQILTIA